jgi:hypothetical protein
LVILAVKRAPEALDTLLADVALVGALDNTMGKALRDFDPDAVLALNSQGREMFLVALARAAHAREAAVFTPAAIADSGRFTPTVTTSFQNTTRQTASCQWVEHGVDWLTEALQRCSH